MSIDSDGNTGTGSFHEAKSPLSASRETLTVLSLDQRTW